jgi:glycosyltransferase involved in cell wall biosynthesis
MNLQISVIIPLYNGAAYIQHAIEGVVSQTLSPLELIVVNDGSNDQGQALVEKIQAHFPIRVVHQENAGQSAARNHGTRLAEGEILAFLDQDDFWYPNHLERLVAPFYHNPRLGWTYSDVDEIDRYGKMVTLNLLSTLPVQHPKRSLIQLLSEDMMILPSASVVLKRAFDHVGGFDESLSGSEDDDLFLRLFQAGYAHEFFPEALGQWRVRHDSASYTAQSSSSNHHYARKLIEAFPDEPLLIRYYLRDCIAPRFHAAAVAEYKKFLMLGQWDNCLRELEHIRYYSRMLAKRPLIAFVHQFKYALMGYPKLYWKLARWYYFFR